MHLTRYSDPTLFYERIENYFEADEAKNALILGIVQRMVRNRGWV